jgi:hypothetical protein
MINGYLNLTLRGSHAALWVERPTDDIRKQSESQRKMKASALISREFRAGWIAFGVFVGGLSILKLLTIGFNVGPSSVFRLLLNYYDDLVQEALAPFDSLIHDIYLRFPALTWLRQVGPHWKHAFLLLLLYIGRDAQVDLARGRVADAWFTLIWGVPIALITSVLSASAAIGSTDVGGGFYLYVVLAFVVFELGRSVWRAFRRHSRGGGHQSWVRSFLYLILVVVVPILVIGAILLTLDSVKSRWAPPLGVNDSGIALLVGFIPLYSLWLILRGAYVGWRDGVSVFSSGSTRLGLLLLVTLAVAVAGASWGAGS